MVNVIMDSADIFHHNFGRSKTVKEEVVKQDLTCVYLPAYLRRTKYTQRVVTGHNIGYIHLNRTNRHPL